jgi:hypothetical protein
MTSIDSLEYGFLVCQKIRNDSSDRNFEVIAHVADYNAAQCRRLIACRHGHTIITYLRIGHSDYLTGIAGSLILSTYPTNEELEADSPQVSPIAPQHTLEEVPSSKSEPRVFHLLFIN